MTGLTDQEIHDRAIYHPPSPRGVEKHRVLSDALEQFLQAIRAVCPDGREASLACTHAEQAKMWASAAVARNPDTR